MIQNKMVVSFISAKEALHLSIVAGSYSSPNEYCPVFSNLILKAPAILAIGYPALWLKVLS
jgi:hypothetical protein